jgi:hypothetical protein
MKHPLRSLAAPVALATLALSQPAFAAVNSYRFLHVTINTPWNLFLFLLVGVLSPFVLMAVLLWRNALRRDELRRAATPPAQGDAPAAPGPAQAGAQPDKAPPR